MRTLTKTAIIPFLLGAPMLVFGLKGLYQVNRFVDRGAFADGIVVEMNKGDSVLSKYHPRVRFQTREGRIIEFIPGNGSNPPMYEINDHVPVVYNPDYPQYALINTFIEIWLGSLIYAGLGLFFTVFSIVVWRKSREP